MRFPPSGSWGLSGMGGILSTTYGAWATAWVAVSSTVAPAVPLAGAGAAEVAGLSPARPTIPATSSSPTRATRVIATGERRRDRTAYLITRV